MRIEDLVFWLLILVSIGIILWLLLGSPQLENATFLLVALLISQMILLWKEFYNLKYEIKVVKQKINTEFKVVNDSLENLRKNVIQKRKKE